MRFNFENTINCPVSSVDPLSSQWLEEWHPCDWHLLPDNSERRTWVCWILEIPASLLDPECTEWLEEWLPFDWHFLPDNLEPQTWVCPTPASSNTSWQNIAKILLVRKLWDDWFWLLNFHFIYHCWVYGGFS